MSWKNVQYENGKFKTGSGGGGGSSTFADLDDVNFSNLQNGQVPKYNSTTQKWENADESGGGGTVTDVEVNGTSVVNAQNVAKIKSYKEITQAEYNALPASKTSDGILYCIKDAGGADGFPPLIYSLEEREVGVWTDGKPLYQKTIHITTIPNSNMVDVPHGISNIDKIVDIKGVLHAKLSMDSANAFTPIPRIQDNQTNQNLGIDVNNTNVRLKARGYDLSYVYEYADVTIYYTKTTDTPGSGTWTTQGEYAHHYSTAEKVVGTWIDGKPIYEKTVYLSSLSFDTNWHNVAHNISNLKRVIYFCGIGMNGDGECFLMNSYRPSLTQGIIITITETNIRYMNNWQDDNNMTAYITVQYTKTTD